MAKKKKRERVISDEAINAFQGKNPFSGGLDMDALENASDNALNSMTPDQIDDFHAMLALALRGITPDEYEGFYRIFEMSGQVAEQLGVDKDADEDDFFPLGGFNNRSRSKVKEYEPLEDAGEKTLVLKIQMKDVTKPPMWREVEVPADYNFMQLHEVIQAVAGLDDYHMWQFNKNAYDPSLEIGFEADKDNPFGAGLESPTHDPEETPLTQFLQQKGDKLEYVYDFGDDWIFVVEVKDVLQKKSGHPVCTKFKSELNAIEDFGGVWAYTEAREDLANWGKMSKKERKEHVDGRGFESEEDYLEFLNEHRFSLEDANEALEFM